MMETSETIDTDIPSESWIDRLAPLDTRPYLRLARADRPIGTWLLLLPCWWSVALATPSWPDAALFVLFAIGSLVMRGAGPIGGPGMPEWGFLPLPKKLLPRCDFLQRERKR